MTNDEKRPTLIRFRITTYQKLVKATSVEQISRGQQVTVPKLIEEVTEPIADAYPRLLKAAQAESERRGSDVPTAQLLEEILEGWLKEHSSKKK